MPKFFSLHDGANTCMLKAVSASQVRSAEIKFAIFSSGRDHRPEMHGRRALSANALFPNGGDYAKITNSEYQPAIRQLPPKVRRFGTLGLSMP
jgi:hypothetical protein